MTKPLKVAMLIPDNRDEFRRYAEPEPVFGPAPEALLRGLAMIPDVEVHVIACTQQPMRAPERIADNTFFHLLPVPKLGWLRTGYQGCIRAIRRKLREVRPDVVHGQGTERFAAIAAAFSGFPNVVTIHGNMRSVARINHARPFSFQWLAARLEGFTLPRTDGVVCITSYTQRAVADLARRTWVIPNAVHESFFDIQSAPATPPVLLCVGDICHRKNQNFFIHAIEPLASDHRFQLRFFGKVDQGEYGQEFRELITARAWCEHGGFADRARLQRELAGASLVMLPSLEDNCPMVVLESAAAGVPVIGARVGGVPELIEPGITGEMFSPTDAAETRQAVERLLANPERARQMAVEAKLQARVRFHPQAIALRHMEVYRELLATGNCNTRYGGQGGS